MHAIETEEYRGLTIKIYPDDDPMSPRECDNLGTMACWHRRYNLGDVQPSCDPEAYLLDLLPNEVIERLEARQERDYQRRAANLNGTEFRNVCAELNEAHKERVMAEIEKRFIVLPLYLYDHSGITMRTSPFSCPWDSGQVGIIHVDLDKVRKEYSTKRITKAIREKAVKCLQSEVEVYSTFIEGGFTGYVVEDEDGEHVDSCWGFDDPKFCMEQAKEAADYEADERAKKAADASLDTDGECCLEAGF